MKKQTMKKTTKNKPAAAKAKAPVLPLPKFKKGDIVQWESQARGTLAKKSGKIIEVVKPLETPSNPGPGWGQARDHRSYVVAVRVGATDRAKPKAYWPKVQDLILVQQ